MKVLITGINGFVGRLLRSELEKRGIDVFGLDLSGKGGSVFPADITRYDEVRDLLEKTSPDFIFHLAAVSRVDLGSPEDIFKVNFSGTLNLLSASVRQKRLPMFLFVSSSVVYGRIDPSSGPADEKFPVKPVNLYGASKAAAENIVQAFRGEFGLPAVIARPFNHTGRGQAENFFVPKLVSAFKSGKTEITLGNIDVSRDYLDARDVVDAYIRIMESFHDGEIFNISSGKTIRISDIISRLGELTGHHPYIIKDEGLLRKSEIEFSSGDSSKLRSRFNWRPGHSLDDTLKWMLGD